MICTCTLNPSLDYYMEFEKPLEAGVMNRSQLEYYEAGGKGINVSIVLNNLLIPNRAFGFLGGFTKDFYISLLQKYEYIQPNFTYIEGATRINVKARAGQDTELNAAGPYITDQDMKALEAKVSRLGEADIFVFSGNCPEYLSDEVVKMLEGAIQDGVRVVIDTHPAILARMLKSHPFLIKTTAAELAQLAQQKLDSGDAVIAAARQVKADGAANVLVTLNGSQDAVLVCDSGTYRGRILDDGRKTVSMVGTGDSIVAGFLMNYLRTSDSIDSFRFGCCCGSATAYSKGLATREKIDSFYEQMKVEKLGGTQAEK
jgi:1-phosphofructokinase